jgi:hypothetical protein
MTKLAALFVLAAKKNMKELGKVLRAGDVRGCRTRLHAGWGIAGGERRE